jgi:hypothetical protein
MVTIVDGHWRCECSFFRTWGTCQHVMAMQKMLEPMLSPEARQPELSIDIQTNGVTA